MNNILNNFNFNEKIISITQNKIGLINTTYIVSTVTEKYVLQKINKSIFNNPDQLMKNIYLITKHLRRKEHRTLEIVRSTKNKLYVTYQDQYWRLFKYIEGRIFEKVDNIKIVSESAKELGKFHRNLHDFSIHNLNEIIPDFHNTIVIFKEFQNALKSSLEDTSKCIEQINYILEKEENLHIISNLLANKKIPLRLCHNDPKINNFLFDEKLNSICLIDLDTVFFGTVITDIADAVRSICVSESEEESNLSKLYFRYDYFECFISSYFRMNQENINNYEKEYISKSIELIYLEQGIRFLTDYLNGNKYFYTSYKGQNLVRAKNQIYLSKEISNNLDKINNIINRYIN